VRFAFNLQRMESLCLGAEHRYHQKYVCHRVSWTNRVLYSSRWFHFDHAIFLRSPSIIVVFVCVLLFYEIETELHVENVISHLDHWRDKQFSRLFAPGAHFAKGYERISRLNSRHRRRVPDFHADRRYVWLRGFTTTLEAVMIIEWLLTWRNDNVPYARPVLASNAVN